MLSNPGPDVNHPGGERPAMSFPQDNPMPEGQTSTAVMEMWREVCRSGGSLHFRILTPSMSPSIEVGDIVKVSGVAPVKVRIGDILAFQFDRHVVVHRVAGKSRSGQQLYFHHRGDAGGLYGKIPAPHLIGKVTAIKREGREIPLNTLRYIIGDRILGWRLYCIDGIGRLPAGFLRTVIHQALRTPWRLVRSIFFRLFQGKRR